MGIASSNLPDVLSALLDAPLTIQDATVRTAGREEFVKVIGRGDELKAVDLSPLHRLENGHPPIHEPVTSEVENLARCFQEA
eukprot:CAMPEP_0115570912 /NCGR_PEP_ID=MMETSP0271-20121206/105944_1 /TAXON_ID=71861 /ORGANISM="Scrippsiella trochoidea, Strain CCMP3099" /LENGTH=81 /DNA_ID=CAMNT_0003005465 /DNA_START=554 /DNA_END=799 /DNA_ORIENTATION=+